MFQYYGNVNIKWTASRVRKLNNTNISISPYKKNVILKWYLERAWGSDHKAELRKLSAKGSWDLVCGPAVDRQTDRQTDRMYSRCNDENRPGIRSSECTRCTVAVLIGEDEARKSCMWNLGVCEVIWRDPWRWVRQTIDPFIDKVLTVVTDLISRTEVGTHYSLDIVP